MIFSFQTVKARRPLGIILATFSVFLLPAMIVYAEKSLSSTTAEEKGLGERVSMIKLYTVQNGKSLNRILGPADFRGRDVIDVDGYVTGILILANVEMDVKVDGQDMSKIRKNEDGTYSIKYFGKIGSNEIGMALSNSYYQKGFRETAQAFVEGYSLFPRVVGDAVSPECSFRISVETGEDSCSLPIRQKGYDTFHQSSDSRDQGENPIEFQYLDERLGTHMERSDFQDRLKAVADGINSVEKAFGSRLVARVKILDYEKVQNAVTCEENTDIWFYIKTFLSEPLDELRTIAEHETLHILVDQKRLAKDLNVRELFSDLRGYDSLSRERFALITRGAAPDNPGATIPYKHFFAFIDEKNFLEGMKGGHSSQNVDEFCTSFLHSLMFVDRLKNNLERPLKMDGEGRHLSFIKPKKKEKILNTYIRTIEALLSAQANDDSDGLPYFLKGCLEQAESVKL
ncbi:MAG: hypothetical protein PHS17_10030 [Desulfobacterales bacterium]|nr:hypothetical protein [Desulfobacterales bacterium]